MMTNTELTEIARDEGYHAIQEARSKPLLSSACSPPRGDIENELDRLAEKLPEGYEVQICVENGAAWLQVITPSGDTVPIDGDCETCWGMLMGDALGFCLTDFEENKKDMESL